VVIPDRRIPEKPLIGVLIRVDPRDPWSRFEKSSVLTARSVVEV
jgi:hypothetical protein